MLRQPLPTARNWGPAPVEAWVMAELSGSGRKWWRQSLMTARWSDSQVITASGQAHCRGPSGGWGVRRYRSGYTSVEVLGRTPMHQ